MRSTWNEKGGYDEGDYTVEFAGLAPEPVLTFFGIRYTDVMTERSLSSVLDRFLDPLTDCLTPEVAKRIVALRADQDSQARLDELAEKANEGRLSESEQVEHKRYIDAIDLITILQLKARSFLDKHNSP